MIDQFKKTGIVEMFNRSGGGWLTLGDNVNSIHTGAAIRGLHLNFNSQMTALPLALSALNATYTRNSVKHVLQNGALVQLAANQFGTSYDPVTGLYGYLPESAATNLALHSEGAAANWAVSNVVDGTTFFGADNALAFGDNSVQRSAHKTTTTTNGVTYSVSFFVIMDDGLAPVIGTSTSTGDFAIVISSKIVASAVNKLIVNCGGGVYRVSAWYTATDTLNIYGCYKYTGQSARGFRITRIQLETGTYASSYIKTAGATATRAADVLTVPLANVARFNAAGYTMVVDGRNPVVSGVSDRAAISVNDIDNVTANRNDIIKSQSGYVYMRCVSSSVMQAEYIGTLFGESRSKLSMSVAANRFILSRNGSNLMNDTSGSVPVGLDTLNIGHNNGGINNFNGYIFNAKLITTPLTQSQLNAITA